MNSFILKKLDKFEVPMATAWLLSSCMEARGKQDLWMTKKPELIEALRELALVQSVESSNRIEGVTVKAERLRPIVLGGSKPKDRAEEELRGYRKALDWIETRRRSMGMEADVVLHLHSLAQGGFSGDAGKWKEKDNEIIEIRLGGRRVVRFKPVSAKETPRAIDELCALYTRVVSEDLLPPLLATASFVLDFLCIHPFRDGNGRVSRLLTHLLLKEQGFAVVSYISPERLIEETKERYYDVFYRSSRGWHEAAHDIIPWWNYFLAILNSAYKEFSERVETLDSKTSKGELVRLAIERQVGQFTLAELRSQLPSVSAQLIKKVLEELKESGGLKLEGWGRGARWEKTRGR